jgi:hypothetical protein
MRKGSRSFLLRRPTGGVCILQHGLKRIQSHLSPFAAIGTGFHSSCSKPTKILNQNPLASRYVLSLALVAVVKSKLSLVLTSSLTSISFTFRRPETNSKMRGSGVWCIHYPRAQSQPARLWGDLTSFNAVATQNDGNLASFLRRTRAIALASFCFWNTGDMFYYTELCLPVGIERREALKWYILNGLADIGCSYPGKVLQRHFASTLPTFS